MNYETRIEQVVIGDGQSALQFEVEVIADFNKAIDDMFSELELRGEQEMLVDLCPYFGAVWDSSRVLANFLVQHPEQICRGRRFLEIGCGLAIPSMVALKMGADRVVATDVHPDVEMFLERNLHRNGIASTISDHPDFSFRRLDWRTSQDRLLVDGFDHVLGSDILYDRGQAKAVAGFLADSFGAGVKAATLTDPGRPYLQEFVSACDQVGLRTSVEIIRLDASDQRRDVFLLEIRK